MLKYGPFDASVGLDQIDLWGVLRNDRSTPMSGHLLAPGFARSPCSRGEHAEGDRCVADVKPKKQETPKATSRQRNVAASGEPGNAKHEQAKREELKLCHHLLVLPIRRVGLCLMA